jgi:PTEN phosphatase family protein
MDSSGVVATSYAHYGDEDDDSKGRQIALSPQSNVNADIENDSISLVNDDASKQSKANKIQRRVLKIVQSLPVRIFTIMVLIADVVLVVIGLVTGNDDQVPYLATSIAFVSYFAVEVTLRIFGKGKWFFKKWYEVLDFIIIALSVCLTVVYVLLRGHSYVRLIVLARSIRFLLWFRFLCEHKYIMNASRHLVSQNKRRFVEDGFDLDLTYVTERVIAMSFPSTGKQGLYRNPIKEVVRLLDTRHRGRYKVYNLCSEKSYDSSYFHGQVERIKIDDHTVPPLLDIIRFCDDVKRWMEVDPNNVIAVHCKGGKGELMNYFHLMQEFVQRINQDGLHSYLYFKSQIMDRYTIVIYFRC